MYYFYGLLLLLLNVSPIQSGCKKRVWTKSRGEIVSEYPNNYCKYWMITGPQNATVTISFDYLNIRSANDVACTQNFLEIGPVQGSLKPRRYCGTHVLPDPFITTIRQDHIWIHFVANASNESYRFKLRYIVGYVPSRVWCHENEWTCANRKCIYDKWRCNGLDECGDNSDETSYCSTTTSPSPRFRCRTRDITCISRLSRLPGCFPHSAMCDGIQDCLNGMDESTTACNSGSSSGNCHKHLDGPFGNFSSPGFPNDYPNNIDCDWRIHLSFATKKIQLRFTHWVMQDEANTDYVIVYDGKDEHSNMIGKYYGRHAPPPLIESSSNWLFVHFHSDDKYPERGFNATFQQKGYCVPGQHYCGGGDVDCYDVTQRCDGFWDCKNFGADEQGCGKCDRQEYSCGAKTAQCYKMRDRCNGNHTCMSYADETNCTIEKCSPDIGLFLCKNKRCIYQWWTCDRTNDCGDNSDEENCTFSTPRVIIAAVVGSMVCSLLLVVALGCTCKVYALRMQDHCNVRHETPLSRMQAELVRRRAPPPSYNEAMRTSEPYNEVQQFLQRMHTETTEPNRNRPLPLIPENPPLYQANSETHEVNIEMAVDDDDVPLISLNGDDDVSSTLELIPHLTVSESEEEEMGCDNEAIDDLVNIDLSQASRVTACWRSGSAKSSDNETSVIDQSVEHDECGSDSADSASVTISLDNVSIPAAESHGNKDRHDECGSDSADSTSATVSLDNVSIPAAESPSKKHTRVEPSRDIMSSRVHSHRARHSSQNSIESNISDDSRQELI